MLDKLRNASKSWVVKILFAMLVLSFVSWGVGDVIRGGFGQGAAIEVGDARLSAQQVESEFRREVDRLQPLFGGKLTIEDARKLGMMERTIDTMVTRTLVDEAGRVLGLTSSDEAVLKAVAANPQLRDERGQFDREALRRAISRAGMTEDQFLKAERANMVRSQMAEALSGGVTAPAALVKPLVGWRQERRVAELVEIKGDSLPLPASPGDEALESHYKDNSARFMAPELRALSILLIRPADVAASIAVTDEQIAEAYQQRLGEFSTPERRTLSQVVLGDEIQAGRAGEMLRQGKSLAAIAEALGASVVDLGEVERIDLPDELAGPVFALPSGGTSQPLKTAFGWHVVKVGPVTEGKIRQLAEVRNQLKEDIRRERSLDVLSDLANKVEDALGGGATLDEAAKAHGLKLVRIAAIDAQGRGPGGKPVAERPKGDAILDVAFRTDQGTESSLTDLDGGGYFLLRVDGVTPPQPRPFAEVRGDVLASWQATKRQEAAQARAEQIAQRVRMGEELGRAAQAFGLQPSNTRPFTREGADAQPLPPQVVSDLFKVDVGGVAVGAVKGNTVVARLIKVVPFDPDKAPALADETKRVSAQVGGDLVDQFLGAVRADLGVRVDRKQLSREE